MNTTNSRGTALKPKRFQGIAIAFALLLGSLGLFGSPHAIAEETPSPSPSPSATVVNKSDGDALRMSVINAVVNYVNNARQATVKLDWAFCPNPKPSDP
ncbi:MAG: hypothetical protein QM758_06350 [Armatimonas sp.]